VAMGCVDVAVEASLKPYDIQALIPIIRGAGGIVTTWDGGDASMGGRVIASGDPRVHREAMALLNDGMAEKLD
jgi:myo-inositol-1(or 4)-monophosphatase